MAWLSISALIALITRESALIEHGVAENFLYMIKHDDYTELDARMLDLLMIVQAEHGGGNNSTFTVRVTSSTRTDTYSSIAAGIDSLKGPLHGGANIKCINMFHHLKEAIKDWTNVDELDTYLNRMLNKEAYDNSGLIYEMIGLPQEIYTPIFAMSRIVGWTAHRIEELNFDGRRIIRPAYKNILGQKDYVPIEDR